MADRVRRERYASCIHNAVRHVEFFVEEAPCGDVPAFWRVLNRVRVPLLAGRRPAAPTGAAASHVSLLRHFKCVIHFDSEIPDRTLKLGMAKQQLHGPQVLGPSVYQRRFRPP
jgi:hypothetical protein